MKAIHICIMNHTHYIDKRNTPTYIANINFVSTLLHSNNRHTYVTWRLYAYVLVEVANDNVI